MSLFKQVVTTRFHDFSTKDSKNRATSYYLRKQPSSTQSEASLSIKLREASNELRQVINVFLNAPEEIMQTLRADTPTKYPTQFFKQVVEYCGIKKNKSSALMRELKEICLEDVIQDHQNSVYNSNGGQMSSIFEELFSAVKQQDKNFALRTSEESEEDFLRRVLNSAQTIPESDWKKLSQTAQRWFNMAAEAINNNQPIPECPGYKEFLEAAATPRKSISIRSIKETKVPKTAKEPTPKKVRQVTGHTEAIRTLALEHPDWTPKQIAEKLAADGVEVKMSTVSTITGDTRHTVNLAKKLGYWNGEQQAKTA